jgi:hypothetical protein
MKTAAFVIGIVAVTLSIAILVRVYIIDRLQKNKELLAMFTNCLTGETNNFYGAKFFMFEENRENFTELPRRKKVKVIRKVYKMVKEGETRINLELFHEIERKTAV